MPPGEAKWCPELSVTPNLLQGLICYQNLHLQNISLLFSQRKKLFLFVQENRLRLKGLQSGTEYNIEITPLTSGGISLESMNAVQRTAPAPPKIKFPLVR